ncbi:MAG: NYN domain-containing protein [Candidatus Omnitrophica bacterium]|nr:NYN domain-containing protein [Candidatus Omnitrophota bacterium]
MTKDISILHQYDFSKETSLIAYLDLTNMFHWQDTLKWKFSVYSVIRQLLDVNPVKEVRIYYGLNTRELVKSENFHQRLRKTGAIVISKPVKWIKKEINKNFFVRPATQDLFDHNAHSKLDELIEYLQEQGAAIEEPKCNFDVEMALDILDAMDKVSGILLFSGDSDMKEPLERLKLKGKHNYIFGVRGFVAKELWPVCSRYIDFGRWYNGPKKRKTHS